MKAFEFDHNLIDSYARFSRSFSSVRAEDIAGEINRQYDAGRFWPDALLSLNPRFLFFGFVVILDSQIITPFIMP